MEYVKEVEFFEDYVEAIREGEIVRVPERVAKEEDLFVLRKVVKLERESHVLERDRMQDVKKKDSRLERWRGGNLSFRKNNVAEDLIDNFHWEIMKIRRRKNLTRGQLAERINISEDELKFVELGELPKDDFVLINKIENYLGISLRREKIKEGVSLHELQKIKEEKEREMFEGKIDDEIEIIE
jgi:ribosome-binding protein aMBF1 (putative translation factor)